ncbi:MAG: hypothetical protein LBM98_11150 [Oscillospiraceae bacterium]|jgi:hypothetical protein|nr:hypothetical protein [Oscillospiraceae bacterium]
MYTSIAYNDETAEFNGLIWRYETDKTPCNRCITKEMWEQADIQELIKLASDNLLANHMAAIHVHKHPDIVDGKIDIQPDGVLFSGVATSNLLKLHRHWLVEGLDWIPWFFLSDLKELRTRLEQQKSYDEALLYLSELGCRKVWWRKDSRSVLVSYKDVYPIRVYEQNDGNVGFSLY